MMMIMTKKRKKEILYIDSHSMCVCVMSYIDGREREKKGVPRSLLRIPSANL